MCYWYNLLAQWLSPQNYMVREALPMAGGGNVDMKTATPVEVGSSEVVVDVTLSYETR